MPPTFAPMLAATGMPRGSITGWMVEPKLDGWRVLVTVDEHGVEVRTRSGRRLVGPLPELAPLADLNVPVVLDGELVAGGGRMGDFALLSRHLLGGRRDRAVALTLVAFDLLWIDGEDVTNRSYEVRRERLEGLNLHGGACVTPRFAGDDAADLLDVCERLGVEGVVLKRRRSIYRPGRRVPQWRKVKTAGWAAHRERRFARK